MVNIIKSAKLNCDFVKKTKNFKLFLEMVKRDCERIDLLKPSSKKQKSFINSRLEEIIEILDNHFFAIWEIVNQLDKEDYVYHRKYYQRKLVPLFEVSPYNRRVYEKPLGYAGDYITMLFLYRDDYEGDTTYAKLIHRYSMRIPTARANHNRKDFYKEQILDMLNNVSTPHITSIACGPAVEIVELLSKSKVLRKSSITCLDFEDKALQFVKEQINSLVRKSCDINITFIKADVIDILKQKKLDSLFEAQDLIYSSGLIDYFSDRLAARMIKVLFEKLKPGGRLIVGNVSKDDKYRAYSEFLGDWLVNHRDENDMIKLSGGIKKDNKITIDYEKETRMNIFLIINKI